MKKFISILLVAMMVVSLVVVGVNAETPEGTAVNNAAEFAAMAADGKYYLAADITLDATYANEFTGTFDGNGKTVTTSVPMFGTVNNATIKNFTVNGKIVVTAKTQWQDTANTPNDFVAAVAVIANGTTTLSGITSNVEINASYKLTPEAEKNNANTRAAAIAGYSAAGHAITIENCVNNGAITVDKYAGGIYGWTDKAGKSTIKNCINNGVITAGGYCAGIASRLAGSGADSSLVLSYNINNAAIISKTQQAAGVMAYSNTPNLTATHNINNGNLTSNGHTGGIVANFGEPKAEGEILFEYNVNNGDITVGTKSYAGGIAGNLADPKKKVTFKFFYNVNNGDITSTGTEGNQIGGILGYAYGRGAGTADSPVLSYAWMNGNVNSGTLTGKAFVSQILAYSNSPATTLTNNLGYGKVSNLDPNMAAFIGFSSADMTKNTITGNYYVENDGTSMYSYTANTGKEAFCIKLADAPATGLATFKADKLAETVATLNTALGATVYEVKDGKVQLVCDHAYLPTAVAEVPSTCKVLGTAAGTKCSACDKVLSGCEALTTLAAHKVENGACENCGALAGPEAGKTILLKLDQNKEGKTLYFNGQKSGNFLACTENKEEAVVITVEAVEGGIRLYFMDGEKKMYVEMYEYNAESHKVGVQITETPTSVMAWNMDLNALTFVNGEKTYYMGTYNTFLTMSASETKYITGSNAANVGVTQFPTYYEYVVVDAPETGDMTWAIVVVALVAVLGSAVVIGRKARD